MTYRPDLIREPKRFISWTLCNPEGQFIDSGDYSPASPKSVAWMTRFVMWATRQGNIVIFRKQDPAQNVKVIRSKIIDNL